MSDIAHQHRHNGIAKRPFAQRCDACNRTEYLYTLDKGIQTSHSSSRIQIKKISSFPVGISYAMCGWVRWICVEMRYVRHIQMSSYVKALLRCVHMWPVTSVCALRAHNSNAQSTNFHWIVHSYVAIIVINHTHTPTRTWSKKKNNLQWISNGPITPE